jgi:hypothetical protein
MKEWWKIYRSIFLANALIILLFLGFTLYVKFAVWDRDYWYRAWVIKRLFEETYFEPIYTSLLTDISEMLWCISFAICLFSFALLKMMGARYQNREFFLASALILAWLLADDVLRVTIFLYSYAHIPKVAMYFFYGAAIALYGVSFRKIIALTPYFFLLYGASLFVLSGVVDLVKLPGEVTPVILEDGTKLLGLINITLYFWQVCRQAILSQTSFKLADIPK